MNSGLKAALAANGSIDQAAAAIASITAVPACAADPTCVATVNGVAATVRQRLNTSTSQASGGLDPGLRRPRTGVARADPAQGQPGCRSDRPRQGRVRTQQHDAAWVVRPHPPGPARGARSLGHRAVDARRRRGRAGPVGRGHRHRPARQTAPCAAACMGSRVASTSSGRAVRPSSTASRSCRAARLSSKGGTSALNQGAGDLAAGAGRLDTGAGQLGAGVRRLAAGAGQVDSGAGQLQTGAGQLSQGLGAATTGSGQLLDGLSQAAGAAPKLQDGAQQLSDQGTTKLVVAGKVDRRRLRSEVRPDRGRRPAGQGRVDGLRRPSGRSGPDGILLRARRG